MTNFPIELLIADAVSLVFLSLGAAYLIKFALNFGSKNIRKYLITTCTLIILFALFHEGGEIARGLYEIDISYKVLSFTVLASTTYFVAAFLLRREIAGLTNKPNRGKDGS